MSIFFIISGVFFLAFAGLSVDLIRTIRRQRTQDVIPDDQVLEREVATRLDAEQVRDEDTGWVAPEFFTREDFQREIPRSRDDIVSHSGHYIPEKSHPLIICPPTVDGMVAAAILLRKVYWARVRVIYKDYLVKSIFKLTRLKPPPDYLLIVGMDPGYVHGRRFMQVLTKLREQDIQIAWYDNHTWLPVIAKNISDLCFDFALTTPEVTTTDLMQRRFFPESDEEIKRISSVLNTSSLRIESKSWEEKWCDLIDASIADGSWSARSKIVRRLSDLSRLSLFDYYAIFRYRERRTVTLDIISQQTCFVDLPRGRRMSILDMRPLHREVTPSGKSYFVFRGKKPVLELPRFTFEAHGSECLFLIQSLQTIEIQAKPGSDIRLTKLIDITYVNGHSVHIDGRDDKITIEFNLPLSYRFKHTLLFRWPPEISALLTLLQSRL